MVVFEDGLPLKRPYRRFSDRGVADDTEAIYQVLTRRLARLDEDERWSSLSRPAWDDDGLDHRARKRFAYRPGLILVDGGQPQVEAAAAGARRPRASATSRSAGIAKRLEEIWLPGADFPVILPRNSEALFLIQRIRDEAHRFAITFQRQKRRDRHRVGAGRDPGPRPGPREGAAQALRIGHPAQDRPARRNRRGARHRTVSGRRDRR